MSVKNAVARKAVRTTAKHAAHGATSKLRRNPVRATMLLAFGCLIGGAAGWLARPRQQGAQPA